VNLTELSIADNSALREIASARIREAGSIPFDEFMSLALYHPQHGYYIAADPSLDYQTSPNVHPVFGAAIARQLGEFWRLLGRPSRFDIFEAGAGSGRLAGDILRALRLEQPDFYETVAYTLQDVSLQGPEAPRRLEAAGLPLDKINASETLPEQASIEGCILSNELLDALPFRRVRPRGSRLLEVNVGLKNGRFLDHEVPASPEIWAYFDALGVMPADGCDAEVNLAAPRWVADAAKALRRGYVLTLDYGYEAPDLYSPWRRHGTLLTFHRHTSGDSPYARIGRQDITASVDFTSVKRAGESAGLTTHRLVQQSEFLAVLGIGDALRDAPAADEIEAYYALRRAVIELTDPAGLGRIRALIQSKDAPAPR
jgi:SAM-dependent MidA family methyltransferase